MEYENIDEIVKDKTTWLFSKPKFASFLSVLVFPIKQVYSYFTSFTIAQEIEVNASGQTLVLEKLVNDRFDNELRRIKITHSISEDVYVFDENESVGNEEYIFEDSETSLPVIYFFDEGEVGADFSGVDFRIVLGFQKGDELSYVFEDSEVSDPELCVFEASEVSDPELYVFDENDGYNVDIIEFVNKYKIASKRFEIIN